MKKLALYVSAIVAAAAALTGSSAVICNAANPICQTAFTPDPAPMVYDDTLYVYTGRDRDGTNDFYYMTGYQVLSTTDMQNWTNHGCFMEDTDFSWGKKDSAWASQCIERNGKFYYYVTFENASGGGRAIGVAVADSPTGPFKDALGKPLVGPNWDYIDPTVMIDDDGQAWLMFGNPTCYYVKLNEDMISLGGQVQKFDMNASTFGPSSNKASSYGEGPWIYKHNNLYYMVFAAFYGSDGGESMGYSTAPSVTGPWTYRGQIMKPHNCFTTHGGIIDYKDRSYFFYHKNGIPGGGTFNRSAAVEEFKFGSDGSIPLLTMSNDGPQQLEALNPYKRTEAETICWSEGVKVEPCSAGGTNIGSIKSGAYVKVKGVDFQDGAETFKASVASNTTGGKIEIHLDSKTGPIVGACSVSGTGGWQSWEEVSCNVSGAEGEHDVYFVYTGGSDYLFNVDWWQFGSSNVSDPGNTTPDDNGYLFQSTFESGTNSWSGRGAASVSSVSGEAYAGSKALYVSGREAAWNGASKTLSSSTFSAGKEYSFSAAVKYTDGPATAAFRMTLQYDLNDETNYDHIDEQTAVKGQYLHLYNPSYKIPAGATNLTLIIETVDEDTLSFYVDEAIGAQGGTEIKGPDSVRLIRGDVSCDGKINIPDLCLLKAGLLGTSYNSEVAKMAADVDQSETVDASDALLLKKYLMGTITEFPVNKPTPPDPPASTFNYNPAVSFKEAPSNYFNPCAKQGTIIKETYNGINGSNTLNVYLPYGYDKSKQYNVFYLMHGGGENENTIFSDDVKLGKMLDNMIMNGDMEPMIVVTPTFNKCTAQTFYKEWRASVIPYVEGKYSTYAKSTSAADIAASRMHRAYGGFSMGSASTWAGLVNGCLDICAYWMPLSGDNWEASGSGYNKAKSVADAIDRSGLAKDKYFIFASTGSDDIAYPNMNPQMDEMKKMSQFIYTSDFSKGNFYYMVAPGKTHWWGFVKHYIYDSLPSFFHES